MTNLEKIFIDSLWVKHFFEIKKKFHIFDFLKIINEKAYLHLKYTYLENKRSYLSKNPPITWDIIKDNPHLPWYFYELSQNPNITWDNVKDTLDEDWNFYELSKNPTITWDNVKNNLHLPWDFYCLSQNPTITWDIAEANPGYIWNYYIICTNEVAKQEFIEGLKKSVNVISDWFLKLKTNPRFLPM